MVVDCAGVFSSWRLAAVSGASNCLAYPLAKLIIRKRFTDYVFLANAGESRSVGIPGDEDNRNQRTLGLNTARDIRAVHSGHREIKNQGVDRRQTLD